MCIEPLEDSRIFSLKYYSPCSLSPTIFYSYVFPSYLKSRTSVNLPRLSQLSRV